MRITTTGFAREQFGEHAAQVVRVVVESMAATQEAGCRAQRAAGMSRRDPFGSVWSLKFTLLVDALSDLVGAEVVPPDRTRNYPLVRVNGRLLLPFKLASSLADIPVRPRLNSPVLRGHTSRTAPPPAPHPSLFDAPDDADDAEDAELAQPVVDPGDAAECKPVLIGVVGNADSDQLLGLYWGVATSITQNGVLEWTPQVLPLQLAPSPRGDLRSVGGTGRGVATPSFTDGEVPSPDLRPRRNVDAKEGEHPAVEDSDAVDSSDDGAAASDGSTSPANPRKFRRHDDGADE